MGEKFWWVYDIVAIAVVVFFIWNGARKGFSRIIIFALGCVAAVGLGMLAGDKATDFVYDKFFMQSNIDKVDETLKEYQPEDIIKTIIEENDAVGVLSNEKIESILKSGNSLDKLYEYTNSESENVVSTQEIFDAEVINGFAEAFAEQIGISLPPYVISEITGSIENNEELFNSTIDMLVNSPEKMPQFIEENYIREPAKRIISAVIFLFVYCVLMVAVVIIVNKTTGFGLLNGYDRLDKFAGGLFGIVEAAAVMLLIATAVKLMINITESENSFLGLHTIEQTKIFKYFYEFI